MEAKRIRRILQRGLNPNMPVIIVGDKQHQRSTYLLDFTAPSKKIFNFQLNRWYSFANLGYRVILFEGPRQGGALRKGGLPIVYAWEQPANAVLDHFELEDVTWLGISMIGWLCFRAAAFEP